MIITSIVAAIIVFISTSIIFVNKNKNIIIIMSLYSSLMVIWYILIGALDVAITEASVGVVLSGFIMVATSRKINKLQIKELKNLIRPGGARNYAPWYITAIIICGLFLSYYMINFFPIIGSPNKSLVVTNAYKEIIINRFHFPNMVTAILSSFRGFDTMLETTVIFLSYLFLKKEKQIDNFTRKADKQNTLPKIFIINYAKIIILYIVYIQINGEISPGGGFQAGALMASVLAAISYICSISFINIKKLDLLSLLGISIYFIVGLLPILSGGNFMEYFALTHNKHIQSICIFLIEIGIALTVFSVMLLIYNIFMDENNSRQL